jgi:hypothetical protein
MPEICRFYGVIVYRDYDISPEYFFHHAQKLT